MMDSLHSALHESQVIVKFNKVDGTVREMLCTLSDSFIPDGALDRAKDTKRESREGVTCVFDIEKQAWRSFRNDNIISWRIA